LIVNCATRSIALSCRSARPAAAQVCQYVVATTSAIISARPITASRVI
jgi:hypothetical protein